tara:strand:- start:42690 stop:59861 length:17172 start_codon:yes stop_codon:yes gene_type:complete
MADEELNVPLAPPSSEPSSNVIDNPPIGFDQFNQFDYQDVIDRLDTFAVEDGAAFGIDDNFRRSVDAAAVKINKYPIGNTGNVNSPYPGNATAEYNPFLQQSPPDLTTEAGRRRYMQSAESEAKRLFPDATPGYTNPIEVGLRSSNFERYYKHPMFGELGWHPYANNEEYYNANSTTWDDLSRMSKEWPSLFGTGFASVYRSVGDLFGDNSLYLDPDLESAMEFEDAMRIGNSTRGGVSGFMNNLALNTAYTFGIIGSIAVEEIAMAGATAAMPAVAPATGARTAFNIGRAGKAIVNSFDVGRAARATKDMLDVLRNSDKAKEFFTLAHGGRIAGNLFAPETLYAIKSIKTAKQAGTNLSNIAKANKYFGGFYRDLRAVNLAMAESKLEAGMVYNKMLNEEYAKYKMENNGAFPTEDALEKISDYASKAAFAATLWNFPLIYGTNKLVLDGALRGFKPMGRVLDETISGVGGRVLRNKKALKDVFYDAGKWQATRLYNKGVKGSARAFGAGALRYLTANFAEGFQEIGQEAIAVGTQDYYTGLLNDPVSGGANAFKAAVSSAVESQLSVEGFEVFMSGFLMGGLVQGPQKVAFQWIPEKFTQVFDNKTYQEKKKAKEEYIESVVSNLNEAWNGFLTDPSQYFDEGKLNSIAQKQLSEEMLSSSFASDALAFMDAKDQSIFQHLYTIASTGKMGEFRDQISAFSKMTDTELTEAFPEFTADVKSGKLRDRFGKMITRSEEIEKNYKELNDTYINPFNRNKYIQGSKEYNTEAIKEAAFNHAKFLMMFTRNTFERAVERSDQIYTEFSQDPIISKIAANEIALFTNLKNLKTEIEVTSKELELDAETPEEIEIQKEKVKRLELLQDYWDILTDTKNIRKDSQTLENPLGVFDRRKIAILRKPFVALLSHFAAQKDDFVDSKRIDETLKAVIDYKYLKGRIQDYHKAIDTLLEPGRMDLLSERMADIMQSIWNERKEDVEKVIKKYVGTKEQNEFLNQLAKIGVYPTPEDAEMFLVDGAIPQNFMDEQGDITEMSDPDKFKQVQVIIEEYEKSTIDEKEVVVSGEEDVGGELDFDTIAAQAESQEVTQPSKGTQNVLTLAYGHYRDNGGKLTPEEWANSKDAVDIRKARAAVENIWFDRLFTDENKEAQQEQKEDIIKEGVVEGDVITFEEWFKEHHKDPEVYRAYNQYGNLQYSDLSVEELQSKELSDDKMLRGQKRIAGDDRGYYVVETTYLDDEGSVAKYYEVVDNNNNNVYDKWKHVVTSLKKNYLVRKEAISDLKMIQANLATEARFSWAGEEFETGAIVVDKKGQRWEVISNSQTIKKFKNLAVVPFGEKSTKKKNIKNIKPDQWKKGGWKFYEPDFSTIAPANEGMVKLRISEPIQFYPHRKTDEAKPDAYERFYEFLSNLNPTELESLVLQVSRNPKWDKGAAVKDRPQLTYDTRVIGKEYAGNPQVLKGSEEFTVRLMIKDNAPLSARFNALFEDTKISPTDIIGYWQGPAGATLLTRDGNVIDPLKITPEEVNETFWFYGDPEKAAKQVQTNYASAFVLNEQLREKLGDKDSVEVRVGDLDEAGLKISPGEFNYDEKKPHSLAELNHNSVAEVDGEKIYWILDMRTVKGQKEERIITNLDPEHPEYEKIADAVDTATKANKSWTPKKYLGRYVAVSRMPNGTYTFVELKASELSEEERDTNIIRIKDRQSLTLKSNVVIIEGTKDREIKTGNGQGPRFNHAFNIETASMMYISSRPGELIDINLEPTSDIRIKYKNKNRTDKSGKNAFQTHFTISAKQMEVVETAEHFVELVNTIIEAKDGTKPVSEQAGAYDGNKKFVPFRLKSSSFRKSIPKRAVTQNMLEDVQTTLQNPVRTNQRLEAYSTNSDEIQKWQTTYDIPADPVEEPTEEPSEESPEERAAREYGEAEAEEVTALFGEYADQVTEGSMTEEEALTALTKDKTEEGEKHKEYNNLEEEIKEYETGLMAGVKAEQIGEGKTIGQANAAAFKAIQNEPTLLRMRAQLEELKKNIGYKILRTFDGNDVEDINVFINWAHNNLPDFITIEDIEGLKERLKANGMTVGAFVLQLKNIAGNVDVAGTIYTGASSPYRYHEAFHSVFRMLLTDEEIEKYLKIAKKEVRAKLRKEKTSLTQALEDLKKLHPIYERMTLKELEKRYYEEYLADEFEKFKKNPGSTETDSENKSLFTKIWEWIKSVFERFTKNELLQLFENIDAGKFKNASRQSNIFTNAIQGGVTSAALAQAIPVETVTTTRLDTTTGKEKSILTNIYLPADQSRRIVSTIGAIYLNKERKWGSKPEQKNKNIPTRQLLDDSIAEFTAMYNPERPFYQNEEGGKNYISIAPKLIKMHNAFIKHQPEIKKAIVEYLSLFNVQYDQERYNEQTFEDDFGLRTTEEWDKDASMIGGFTSLSTAIRKFIATTSIAEADEFGNRVVDPDLPEDQQETLVQAVDYIAAYNGLLKAVKDTTDPMLILQKMHWFGEGNRETAAVVERIFTEIGVTSEDVESGQLPEIKNKLFFQSILNGFHQFRVDYLFVHTDLSGTVHLYAANNRDDAYTQLEQWSQAFDAHKIKYENDTKAKKRIERLFSKIESYFADDEGNGGKRAMSNPDLEKKSKEISDDLYDKIGIRLSPTYLAYSIARGFEKPTKKQIGLVSANQDVNPITWEDINEIGATIQRDEHLFLNIEGEGSSTRLTKLAVANGLLDENVGATVFLNPEGNFVYAHQMPTYHLEKVAELNDVDALEEMKQGDVFLERNYLLNDPKFQALAREGKLKVLRLSGSKEGDLEQDDETGAYTENNFLDINKKKGVTYGDSTPRQFILDLINIYAYSYNRKNQKVALTEYTTEGGQKDFFATTPHLIRVIEASDTGDFVPLPVIKSVEYDEEGELSPSKEAIEIAIEEIKNEYLRIRREANQESGYTEDDYVGYNDTPQGRAFQLWYTGNLVTKRSLPSIDRSEVKTPYFGRNNGTKDRVLVGSQNLLIRSGKAMRRIGLRTGNEAYVTIGKGEDAKEFLIRNKGLISINEGNRDKMFEGLGDALREDGSKNDKRWSHQVKIGNKSLWTDTKAVADFLNGVVPKYVFELIPKEDVTEIGLVEEKTATVKEEIVESMADVPLEAFGKEDLLEDYDQKTGEVIGGEPAAPVVTLPVISEQIKPASIKKGKLKKELPIEVSESGLAAMKELQDLGHNSLIIGGAVRDVLSGIAPKDIDIEVYGISYEDLEEILKKHGKTNVVGKAFGVVKFKDEAGNEYDFSVPRKESKVGVGHKDFKISVDPTMTVKEAAKRRDFTWNALAYDPATQTIYDYFGGIKDLKAGIMKHTSEQFAEDPLRVMRALQFQSRMNVNIAPETMELMKTMVSEGALKELPIERITEEWMKWATKGKSPALLFNFLRDTGLMPEFGAIGEMAKTKQDPEWHPEGDVEVHTGYVMSAAVEIADREGLTGDDRAVLMFSALLHDVAKPATTITETTGKKKGRITSRGHEEAGGPMAREILSQLGIKPVIIDRVATLIESHLAHVSIAAEKVNPQKAARSLANRLGKGKANIQDLLYLIEADMSGRPPLEKGLGKSGEILKALSEELGIEETPEADILRGQDLIDELGMKQGSEIGVVLDAARIAQEAGEFTDKAGAIAWAKGHAVDIKVETGAVLYEKDTAIKEALEKSARRGDTFDEALETLDITIEALEEMVAERMMTEFKEFEIALGEIKAYRKISESITEGLKSETGKITETSKQAMDDLNLREGDTDFNLAQVFFNDWLNTKAFNDILLGDQAMTLKDAIDQIKRAKMQNAAGPTAASIISAPEYGIHHPTQHISLLNFEEPQFTQTKGVLADKDKPGQKADAQAYATTKAFKHIWFGLGRLSIQQVELLDKIDKGEYITSDEFFGAGGDSVGYEQYNAMINSKKLVYGDGKTYLKMSVIVLTKKLTSWIDPEDPVYTEDSDLGKKGEPKWSPLPGREELHNLREKMEKWENQKDDKGNLLRETIALAAPASASKMLKKNLATVAEAYSEGNIKPENITDLDANYLRLQQITPSNKLEINDPVQVKSLITSEHKDSEKVIIGGKEMTVGEIRDAYHKSVSDRVTIQYIGRRNLIFDLPVAMDELHKSINLGGITPDLRSFLRYALINLEASQVKSQMLEFFDTDLTGEPKYDLNNPITIQKFQELFLSFFSKGIINENIPGHAFTLISDMGLKVIKEVIAIDEDTGQPSRWEVIRTDEWSVMENRPTLVKEDYDNVRERTFEGLQVGDHYVDGLRHNVKMYDKSGKETGEVESEMMAPPHFKSVMDKVLYTDARDYKSKEDIFREWFEWIHTMNYSPKRDEDIIRADIDDFNPSKSRVEFAAAFGYTYNEIKDDFEDRGTKEGQKIPEVVAKMFGVRIPSQDKHSAINLKVVDFLPVYYGSSAVFPEDLIEVSGADFDIDVLYTHIKEFYNVDKDFYEYGKGKTEDEKYADYIRYTVHKASKKGNVISDALEAWNEDIPGDLGNEKGVISGYLTKREIEERIGPKPEENDPNYIRYIGDFNNLILQSMLEFGAASDKTIIKLWEKKKFMDLMGAMETLHLPVTKKQYLEYKEKHNREPYTGAINNDVLDYKFALLGNKGMAEPQDGRRLGIKDEPADLVPLSDEEHGLGVWDYIVEHIPELAETIEEAGVDIDNMLGKLKAWTNNKEGARSIGAVVLPNVIMNILAEHNIVMRSKITKGIEEIPQLRLNGYTYRDFNTKYEIDPYTGEEKKKGFRTQYVISALVTAMTDNAKERLAAKLGLNRDALAVVTNLVALGVGIKTAVLLVNQPTTKDAYFTAINKDDPKDPGVKAILKRKVREMQELHGDELYPVPVTDQEMVDSIRGKKTKEGMSEEEEMDAIRFEFSVITQFLIAHRIKEYTGKMQSLVTLSKGFGRDTEAIDKRNIDIEDLGIELSDNKFATKRDDKDMLLPIDVRGIFNEAQGATSYQARYYTIYKEFTQELLPSVFLTRTPDFVRIKDVVLANLTDDSFYMSPYRVNQIEKDILSYISIKAYMRALGPQGNGILKASLQNGFIYEQQKGDHLTLNTVISRLKKHLDNRGKSNYFLDNYVFQDKADNESNNSGINRLRSNTWTRMNDSQIVNLQSSFLELYSDLDTRADAIHLVHYILVKDAMQYKGGTILDAIPAHMFDNLLQQVRSAHNAFNLKTKTEEAFKRILGSSLPELYNEFVDGYLRSQNNYWLLPEIKLDSTSVYNPGKFTDVKVKKYGANIRKVAQADNEGLYVFADNASGTGKIGQQLLRGLSNAKPLQFKLNIGHSKNDYYDDSFYTENVEIIDENINDILKSAEDTGLNVIFPDNLLGNSKKQTEEEVARMEKYMPETFKYLNTRIKEEFNYDISTGVREKIQKSVKAFDKPVYINNESKRLVVDLYSGLLTHLDRKTGVRKLNRWSGGRTKTGKKIPAWKVALSKFETLKRNMGMIMHKGFEKFDVEIIEGRQVRKIGFPYMVRVDIGTQYSPEWKYYKLETVWGNADAPVKDLSLMIGSEEVMAYGNRAEYTEIELEGAYAVNPTGFVYGPRPTNNEIKSWVNEKNEGQNVSDVIKQIEDEGGLDKLAMENEEEGRIRAVTNAEKVSYVDGNIEIETESGDKTNIANVDSETVPETSEEESVASAIEGDPDQDDITFAIDDEEATNRGQQLSSALSDMLKSKEPTYPVINDFWNGLQSGDRAKLRKALGIETVEGLISEFTVEDNIFTEEEFIEDINSCHL